MTIYVENKKRKIENIEAEYPGATILDVTSTSPSKSAQELSPFYPHGGIPVPFSPGLTATCVEAIWQGLKVFQDVDIDVKVFQNNTMQDLKRSTRKFGIPQGHRKGVNGQEILNYFEARMLIYLPSYKWVLENIPTVRHAVERIKKQSQTHDMVLLDYNTNIDFRDTTKPLSHAGLLKLYIEGNYPDPQQHYTPMTLQELEQKKEREKEEKKRRKAEAKKRRKEASQHPKKSRQNKETEQLKMF